MILISSIICKYCLTRLVSRHRHDYQECECGKIALDGGLDYQKIRGTDYIDASITSEDPHDRIRCIFEWGSYGKNGDSPLHYIKLRDMELSHIGAILDKQSLLPELKKILVAEINFRTKEGK